MAESFHLLISAYGQTTRGELVMRIQSFNTDDNSVSQIEGIYPSEMLYTLALEHRKNRTDSLYVTDEQLER